MYLDVYERDTSRYDQDTCKIHRNTSGYVSDRKPPPKRIGNPTSPVSATLTGWLAKVIVKKVIQRRPFPENWV